jgi:Flp pilus assembly protein TadG
VRRQGGQSLLELGLCLPLLLAIGLGSVAVIRLADARMGLEVATSAAAATAARAAGPAEARAAGQDRFDRIARAYAFRKTVVSVDTDRFQRGGTVRVTSSAQVDLAFAPVPGIPSRLLLQAAAGAEVERWRSRILERP